MQEGLDGSGGTTWRRARDVLLVAIGYFAAAELGLLLSFVDGNVTPVFPAAGVAIAVATLGGRHLVVGVFLGALAAHLRTDVGVVTAVAMSIGSPLGALVGSTVLRSRRLAPSTDPREVRNVAAFIVFGAALPATIAAIGGIGTLAVRGVLPVAEVPRSLAVWWIGDTFGALVVGSLLLAWWSSADRSRPVGETVVLIGGTVAATAALFLLADRGEVLMLPLLVLVAVRLESRWTTVTLAGVALVAAGATAAGRGPVATADVHDSLLRLSLFLAAATVTTLMLSAAVHERDRSRRALAEANETLEARVSERTEELAASEATLRATVANVSDAVWIVGADRVVRFANPAAEQLLGIHQGEDLEAPLVARQTPPTASTVAIANAVDRWMLSPAGGDEVTWRIVTDDGERIIAAVGNNLLHDPAVAGVVVTARDVTGLQRRADELWHQANHDPLTGLPNRLQLMTALAAALATGPVGVVYCDLDRLKQINDSFGHDRGDELIRSVAQRLGTVTRSGDLVARLSGDEFAVVARNVTTDQQAAALGQRFLGALAEPFSIAGRQVRVTASIGVAYGRTVDGDALLRLADAAMYRAKRSGGGQVAVRRANPPASAAAAG